MKPNLISAKFLTTILSLFFLIFFSASIFANEKTIKVIFDNDASSDDAMALIYLARKPNVKIEGITVAGTGEAHGPYGASNMADICYLLGKPNIPIAYGRAEPLSDAGKPFPSFLRDLIDKFLIGKNVPKNPTPNISDSAAELIKTITEQSKEKIVILATGPLTNIAQFIQAYPQLKNKISKIVIMGGAVRVPGTIRVMDPDSDNTVAEWNIYADPKAADIVFQSGIPITLVPLDATNQVPMTKEFYDLLSKQERPDLKLIYQLLKVIVDKFGMDQFLNEFYLWDPLAAMIAIDPKFANVESLQLTVTQDTAQTKEVDHSESGNKIDVAMQVPDAKNILTIFFDSIKKSRN